MEWFENLNKALTYLEENLAGEIDYDKAAQIACCSTYHFQRMFSYIADVPLSEYIRRRRLTKAAFDLQNSGEKIIDIALRYGYDSPTAFTRAFQKQHGVTPTAARGQGVLLRSFPRITFTLTIKGDVEMEYKIVKLDAFQIVGYKKNYAGSGEENMQKVPLFWQEVGQSGGIPKLCTLMDQKPLGILGVSTYSGGSAFDYFIAVASDKAPLEGMESYQVPACTWAVFESVGPMPRSIQGLQKRIITEWLPSSGYSYADAPDIEVYGEGDQQAADYRCQVWLPVTKKA